MSREEFDKTMETTGARKPTELGELFATLDTTGSASVDVGRVLSAHAKQGMPDNTPSVPPKPAAFGPSARDRKTLRTSGILAFRNGSYREAINLTEEAILGGEEQTADYLLLSRCYLLTEERIRGRQCLSECIASLKPPYSHAPEVTGTLLCTVAETAAGYGDKENADRLYDEYLVHMRRFFGEDSLVSGDAFTLAGAYAFRSGDYEQAVKYCETAKRIRERHLSFPHARLADAFCNCGLAFKAAGKLPEAVQHFSSALQQREKLFGPEHLLTADVQFSLAQLLDPEKARLMLKGCLATRAAQLGNKHPDTVAVLEAISRLSGGAFESESVRRNVRKAGDMEKQNEEEEGLHIKSGGHREVLFTLPVLTNMDESGRRQLTKEAIQALSRAGVPLPSIAGGTVYWPQEVGTFIEQGLPPVLPLLDERTGKKLRDTAGEVIQVVNPAICGESADGKANVQESALINSDSFRHSAAGIWRGVSGLTEVVDKSGTPLAVLPHWALPEIAKRVAAPTVAVAEPPIPKKREPRQSIALNLTDILPTNNYLVRRLELEGPERFGLSLAKCEDSLIEDLDADPLIIFSGLPANQKTSEMRRFRFFVTFLHAYEQLPLEATGQALLSGLREARSSELFGKILKSLGKVAVALGKTKTVDQLSFPVLADLLEIKGDSVSLASYFGKVLREQRPELLDFKHEIALALKVENVARDFERMEKYLESYKIVLGLKSFLNDVPATDPLMGLADFVRDLLPGRTANIEALKTAVIEEFLEVRSQLGLPITGRPISQEIEGFLINLGAFVARIADTNFN